MNPEQAKSSVRWAVTAFGGMVAGFLAGKGWVSADTVMSALNSEAFLSFAATVVMLIWGLVTHTEGNAIATVAAIADDPTSPVRGIVTANTNEGRALANSIETKAVAAAGTPEAKTIATPGATL